MDGARWYYLRDNTQIGSQVRPWVRLWAKLIDLFLFLAFMGFIIESNDKNAFLQDTGIFLSWIPVEALLLTTFGTTPGKKFFKVNLAYQGQTRIPFNAAIKRSFLALLCGLGPNINFWYISLLTLSLSYFYIKKNFITFWDAKTDFTVSYETMGKTRIFGLVLFILVVSIFAYLGAQF